MSYGTPGEVSSRLIGEFKLPFPPVMLGEASRAAGGLLLRSSARQERRAAVMDKLFDDHPKHCIDGMVVGLPDEPPMYPAAQKDALPESQPSLLERSFRQRMPELGTADLHHQKRGALSPFESISCLRDKVRTKLFMQGVAEGIAQLEASGQRDIQVCDAGTGAIPALAIYAALCSEKVHCTALELNPRSALFARQMVGRFGLQDRVTVVEADATAYEPPEPLDMLISETMHSGLTAEPMVQILSHLQPFVKPQGLTLPSAVDVKAALVSEFAYEYPQHYVKIQTTAHPLITPRWQQVLRYTPGQQLSEIEFTLDGTDLPPGRYAVAMSNDVVVGSRTLRPLQSLITMPQYCRDAERYVELFDFGTQAHTSQVSVSYAPGASLDQAARWVR